MVSKPSFDIHESSIDIEGRHAAILNCDRRLTVSVSEYEAGFARHAFTLTVLDRALGGQVGGGASGCTRDGHRQARRRPVCFHNATGRFEPWSMLTTLWNGAAQPARW